MEWLACTSISQLAIGAWRPGTLSRASLVGVDIFYVIELIRQTSIYIYTYMLCSALEQAT